MGGRDPEGAEALLGDWHFGLRFARLDLAQRPIRGGEPAAGVELAVGHVGLVLSRSRSRADSMILFREKSCSSVILKVSA